LFDLFLVIVIWLGFLSLNPVHDPIPVLEILVFFHIYRLIHHLRLVIPRCQIGLISELIWLFNNILHTPFSNLLRAHYVLVKWVHVAKIWRALHPRHLGDIHSLTLQAGRLVRAS